MTNQPASDRPQTSPDLPLAESRTTPEPDDSPLLALEKQFNVISAELLVAQSAGAHRARRRAQPPPTFDSR